MINLKKYFYLIIIVLFVACATPMQLPKDISLQNTILLPFKIDTIVISDLRTDTVTTNLKLPVFVTRPKEWIVKPALKTDLRNEVSQMIQEASNSDGLPAKITFTIKDGYYKIDGDAMKVGEHTLFACSIKFELSESGSYWTASANAFYDLVGQYNATEKHAKEIYRITVRNCVFNALKQGEKVFDEEN